MALALGSSRRHSGHRGPITGPPLAAMRHADLKSKSSLDAGGVSSRVRRETTVTFKNDGVATDVVSIGKNKEECDCFLLHLVLGMVGFVVFWTLLMLKLYLPSKYWHAQFWLNNLDDVQQHRAEARL